MKMRLGVWALCGLFVLVQGTAAELSKEYAANTVPGEDQIRSSGFVRFEGSGREGGLLVVGSSYAWHGPKPKELGWHGDWGMAASAREKDAVHLLWKAVKRVKPDAPLCIAQSACWERNYTGDVDMLERDFTAVKVFRPDWICIVTTVGNAQPDFAERHPIDRHYDVMVDWFRRLNPKAKIVLSVTDRIPAIGVAVRRYGKEHGFPVVDHGFLNEPNSGYRAYGLYEHPGVAWHPSDRGMAEMAARYARALGLKPEVDIDLLCPPRPETAAVFKEGAYPSAVKSYRETALAVYRYMTSLPAMTVLVETGKPNQKYQHNAYVSKTHAAHIEAMLDWAKLEPEKRETAMCFAKASAEYLLKELEPASAPLAFWPPTYGRKPLEFDPKTDGPYKKPSMIGNEPEGAVKYRGEVMLLYPATVGSAFVDYWRETGDERFLTAAKDIAGTYLKTRRADGSWPLKMNLATGKPVGENTLVPTRPLELFEKLFDATQNPKWRVAADACFVWLEAHPLIDWNWDGQFEDIKPEKPYKNPTKHNAVDTMLYMLKRFPGDRGRLSTCRQILEFCEKRFVVWEAPSTHPNWLVPSVLEQYSCFTPIDASAAKMIRAYVAMYKAEGRSEDLAKARALANTVTRVQKASGRIPTFWEGVNTGDSGLSDERYDWLNCMAATASALVTLADADQARGRDCAE